MSKLNARGNLLVTVDDITGVGQFAADGSLRVTVVDGTTRTGLYAADGSTNVVIVLSSDLPPTGVYHPCGALRGVTPTKEKGSYAPNGAIYMDGLA